MRTGQHLLAVFADGDVPAFIYTIGNALQGLPELLLVGNFDRAVTGTILNVLGARMRAERQPLEGDLEFGAAFPARVRRATAAAKQRFTTKAGRFPRPIGRATRSERVCQYGSIWVVAVSCTKKQQNNQNIK